MHAVPLRHSHLLLDLDGTVLDFEASQWHALQDTVAWLGVSWDPAHAVRYHDINTELWEAYERHEIAAEQLRSTRWTRFLGELSVSADVNEVAARYLRQFAAGAHVLDGALEAVEALARRMTIVAVTNGFGDVQRERLARSGLDRHLAGVVVSDEVGHAKPHSAIFDAAFEIIGNPARDDVAIVGDSLTSDIAGGHAYGITTVLVARDGAGLGHDPQPDLVVRRVADLV